MLDDSFRASASRIIIILADDQLPHVTQLLCVFLTPLRSSTRVCGSNEPECVEVIRILLPLAEIDALRPQNRGEIIQNRCDIFQRPYVFPVNDTSLPEIFRRVTHYLELFNAVTINVIVRFNDNASLFFLLKELWKG